MGCEIRSSPGFAVIACSRGDAPKRCHYCTRPGTLLCDYIPDGSTIITCDRRLCGQCARHVGEDRDWCRMHPVAPKRVTLHDILHGRYLR